jgi:hypothetical protein
MPKRFAIDGPDIRLPEGRAEADKVTIFGPNIGTPPDDPFSDGQGVVR